MAPPSALRAATSPSLRDREDQEGRHKTASELSSNCRDFDSHAVTILLSTPGAARGCFRSATWHRFPPCPSPPAFPTRSPPTRISPSAGSPSGGAIARGGSPTSTPASAGAQPRRPAASRVGEERVKKVG